MAAGIQPNSIWAQVISPLLQRISANVAPGPTQPSYDSQWRFNPQTGHYENVFGNTAHPRTSDIQLGQGPSTPAGPLPQLPQRPALQSNPPIAPISSAFASQPAFHPSMHPMQGAGLPPQLAARLAAPTGPFAGNNQTSMFPADLSSTPLAPQTPSLPAAPLQGQSMAGNASLPSANGLPAQHANALSALLRAILGRG